MVTPKNEELGSLEERLEQIPTTPNNSYNHSEIVERLCRSRYCSREYYTRIISTSTREELIILGHEIKHERPMLAANIFRYTKDENGIKEITKILFNSRNPDESSYAYWWAIENPETLKEYCEALLRNKINPEKAFEIAEMLGSLPLAKQAYEELKRIDPMAVESKGFRKRYEELRKTPVPSKALKAFNRN